MANTFNHNDKVVITDGGSVGIGTNNPIGRLHITQGGSSMTQVLIGNTGTGGARTYYDGSNGDFSGNDYMSIGQEEDLSGVIDMALNAGSFHIQTSNSKRLTVTQAGNVGIGTTSPSTKLYVDGGETTFNRGNSDGAIARFRGKNAEKAVIGTVDSWFSSNVGIGTTSPSKQLEILYPSYIDKDTVQGLIRLTGQSNTENSGDIPSAGVGIEFYNKWSGGAPYSIGRISARGSQSYDGGLQFDVAQNSAPGQSNFTTAMTILDTGNVGIGTTSPSQKLEVIGDIRIGQNSAIRFNTSGSSNDPGLAMLSDASFEFYNTSSSTTLKITNGGNVGIGTTSPGVKLHVVGTENANWVTQFSNGSTNGHSIFTGYNNGSTEYGLYIEGGAGDSGSYDILVSNNKFTVRGDGNVGIGTTSPAQKLHVSSASAVFQLTDTNKTANNSIWVQALSQTSWGIGTANNASSGTKITIADSGNVGIGTTSPGARLNVSGVSAGAAIDWSNTTATTGRSFRWVSLNTGGFAVEDLTASGANRLTITSSGRLGIGTSSPAYHIHGVSAETGWGYSFQNATINEDVNVYMAHGGGYGIAVDSTENASSKYLLKLSGGTGGGTGIGTVTRMIVTTSGNVGIGTTSPSEKLDVSGNIKTSGVIYVSATSSTALTLAANDWIDIAEMSYGENHGKIAFEWNGLSAPSSAHHGWFEIEVGTYYSSSFNYGQDTYVEVTKALAHNDFWLSAVRAVDYGSTVRIQVQVGRAVTAGTFRSLVLHKNQGAVTSLTPAINSNSYTVLALANVGEVDGDYVQKAIGNRARFSKSVAFDDKVGIGTTSPEARLDVQGDGNAVLIRRSNGYASIKAHSDNGGNLILDSHSTSGAIYLNNYVNRNVYIATGGGNVGIGTTSPGAKLEVFGTGNTLRLDSAANGSKEILFRNVGTGTATIKTDGDLKLYVEDAGKNILFDTTGGEKMRITAAGNVGIGTTSPDEKLHVVGAIKASRTTGASENIFIYSQQTAKWGSSTYPGIIESAGNNSFLIGSSQNIPLHLTRSGAIALTIGTGGNVGIGTTSPAYKLEVSGGAISIKGNAAGNSLRFDDSGGTSRNAMYVDTSNYLNIGNSNYAGIKFYHTATAPTANSLEGNQIAEGYGTTDEGKVLADPDAWLAVRVGTTDYAIPMYTTG